MSSRRDWAIAITAAAMVLLLAGSVVLTLMAAERNGRRALEALQMAQVTQLGHALDGAVAVGLKSPGGLTNGRRPWNLTVGDPADAAGLDALQEQNPSARTGAVLVNRQGIITAGSLLTSPSLIGTRLNRPGLDKVLGGAPALLSVSRGLTTPLPTIALARPITGTDGTVRGALVQESEVAADSIFNQTIVAFRQAKTDVWSFIDATGTVVASTNPTALAKPADPLLLGARTGFSRHGGTVTATASLPVTGWRAAFQQKTSEFEGGLTGPLHNALLLLIFVALIGAGVTLFALLTRLRAARLEQRRLASIAEAREEFISIVSHELRTPASGQLGFLETLLDHWAALSDEERRQAVGQAFSNARRLHALTRDVLDTASIEAGELPYSFQTIDLGAAAQAVVQSTPAREHHIVLSGNDVPLEVQADPERIQQVLVNLIENAIKNSPTGSTVEVRLASSAGGMVMAEVSDRGLGMTDDEISRAFEKFSRGRHSTIQGTGLGLYICKKIIDTHGGTIWAERRDGGGATVAFRLPRSNSAWSGDGAGAGDPLDAAAPGREPSEAAPGREPSEAAP